MLLVILLGSRKILQRILLTDLFSLTIELTLRRTDAGIKSVLYTVVLTLVRRRCTVSSGIVRVGTRYLR